MAVIISVLLSLLATVSFVSLLLMLALLRGEQYPGAELPAEYGVEFRQIITIEHRHRS